MNNDKSKPFDLEAAKAGEPVEIRLYRVAKAFLDEWNPVHFIGMSSLGNPIVQDDANSPPYPAGASSLRMAPKKVTVRYRAYTWKDSDGSIRPGITDPKKMPYANPEMGEEFIEWIHTDWQEVEITPPEST